MQNVFISILFEKNSFLLDGFDVFVIYLHKDDE